MPAVLAAVVMPVDLVYVVSQGRSARMILQTGLLGRVVAAGYRVAVVTTAPDDENLRAACAAQGVDLHDFHRPPGFWRTQYWRLRPYLLENLDANPAFRSMYHRQRRAFGTGWLGSVRSVQPGFYRLVHRLMRRLPAVRRLVADHEWRVLRSRAARRLLLRLRPKLVVATYSAKSTEAELLATARSLDVGTIVHLLSWDNITSRARFPVVADRFIAWGPIMEDEIVAAYGVGRDRVRRCGVPQFDLHVQTRADPDPGRQLQRLRLVPTDPYLVFAMSAPVFAPREIDIVEWLAAQVRSNRFGPRMQLVVRPHPSTTTGPLGDRGLLPRLEALASGRVGVDFPSWPAAQSIPEERDMHHLSNLLAGAAVTINSGSTVAIDALMVNRPVVMTSFDADERRPYWDSARRFTDYPHLAKFLSLGGVRVARSYDDLARHIQAYLDDPQLDWAARQLARARECGPDDGNATARVAAELVATLAEL